ncbi:MAG: hypothetical protein IKQ91_07510 [Oscillospiraceae bacterium]|nr:hypothetical protein [Oscillospiraceae bacterium]
MENNTLNPFENEKPKLVHLEKDESHYEYCRMQMHDIERTHRRTFICNLVLCIFVAFLAIFQKYVAGFGALSSPLSIDSVRRPGAILAGGIFQIIIAMIIIVLGYLAWANFHTLNIFLEMWYVIVTIVGVVRLDYISALIGIVGAVFYFFSLREMQHEAALAEMEGYPEFQEKFDIAKSDIVIQTLLAHQGERRTKSTLFTTDYSLRKKKKKQIYYKDGNSVTNNIEERDAGAAGEELAKMLQKQLSDVKDARETRTAIASLDAVAAEKKREAQGIDLKEMADITSLPAEEPAEIPQPAKESAPEQIEPERADAEAAAAAILAEAEAKAAAILAAAEEKAQALSREADHALEKPEAEAVPEQPAEAAAPEKPAAKPAAHTGNPNPNRKKKKKR